MERTLEELRAKLGSSDIVGATTILQGWHPRVLANLLLATHAARILHDKTSRWTTYEDAVLALAWDEGVATGQRSTESALSVIEMAVDFNLQGG